MDKVKWLVWTPGVQHRVRYHVDGSKLFLRWHRGSIQPLVVCGSEAQARAVVEALRIDQAESLAGSNSAVDCDSLAGCDPAHIALIVDAAARLRHDDDLVSRAHELLAAADSKTDSKKKSRNLVPENPDVARLAKRIRQDLPKGGTKVDIARDFADGDEKKAQSLLRKLRDFPDLLR